MFHLRLGDEVRDEVERRGVEPLQIVEEQHERVFWSSEYAEEALEDRLESVLGLRCRKVRHRWLRPDDELERGNEVDDELTVRLESRVQRVAPPAQLRLA